MLSGIKVGRVFHSRLSAALSIYHSFYFNSFKAEATLTGFSDQPRLFINCVGAELEYTIYQQQRFSTSIQLLTGWGFLKYDGKQHSFESEQVNYIALEPVINSSYRIASSTIVGLGIGYRPILVNDAITYTSDVSNGEISVYKKYPNGFFLLVSLTGYL
ncbi:hypothetical protein QNI19_08880 [Cytophagaceae bacterium DM2B3-1]|uniref:Outer membrane protein beta-barrel domain-containing protein n=1 Tax=Xanthocytophaga flava TaxID=3048013 RepID=A0ABT7CH53_9BACT|nr:hypothetical protein [Xanthocytophaga flavus]MDJ1493045.1 hypothetical protein [Xanthocytophaga flavus]